MPVTRGQYFTSLPATAITGLTANRIPIINGAGVLTTRPEVALTGDALAIALDTVGISCTGDLNLQSDDDIGILGNALAIATNNQDNGLYINNTTGTDINNVNSGGHLSVTDTGASVSVGDNVIDVKESTGIQIIDSNNDKITLHDGDITVDGPCGFSGGINTATLNVTSGLSMSTAVLTEAQGAVLDSAAVAGTLLLLDDGNYFEVINTTNVSMINSNNFPGREITLHFRGILTINHNTGTEDPNTTRILLSGGVGLSTAVSNMITLRLCEDNGVLAWRQVGSAVKVA